MIATQRPREQHVHLYACGFLLTQSEEVELQEIMVFTLSSVLFPLSFIQLVKVCLCDNYLIATTCVQKENARVSVLRGFLQGIWKLLVKFNRVLENDSHLWPVKVLL